MHEVLTPAAGALEASRWPEAHYAAVRELTVAHLVELLVLRLFGPAQIEAELRLLASEAGQH